MRHSAPPFAPLLQLRIRSTAKSIAPCRMHLQKNQLKNLRGGLRCATRGWHLKSLYSVLKYEACLKLLYIKGYKSFSIFSFFMDKYEENKPSSTTCSPDPRSGRGNIHTFRLVLRLPYPPTPYSGVCKQVGACSRYFIFCSSFFLASRFLGNVCCDSYAAATTQVMKYTPPETYMP